MVLKTHLEPFREPLKDPPVGQPKNPFSKSVWEGEASQSLKCDLVQVFFSLDLIHFQEQLPSWLSVELMGSLCTRDPTPTDLPRHFIPLVFSRSYKNIFYNTILYRSMYTQMCKAQKLTFSLCFTVTDRWTTTPHLAGLMSVPLTVSPKLSSQERFHRKVKGKCTEASCYLVELHCGDNPFKPGGGGTRGVRHTGGVPL